MVPCQRACTTVVLGMWRGATVLPNMQPCTAVLHGQPQCTIVANVESPLGGRRALNKGSPPLFPNVPAGLDAVTTSRASGRLFPGDVFKSLVKPAATPLECAPAMSWKSLWMDGAHWSARKWTRRRITLECLRCCRCPRTWTTC